MHKIQEAVIEHFINTQKPITVKDLADLCACSIGTAKKLCEDGWKAGILDRTKVSVPRYDKSYKMLIGYRDAAAFQPSSEHLAYMVRVQRCLVELSNSESQFEVLPVETPEA